MKLLSKITGLEQPSPPRPRKSNEKKNKQKTRLHIHPNRICLMLIYKPRIPLAIPWMMSWSDRVVVGLP